jgi:hypothetical protein
MKCDATRYNLNPRSIVTDVLRAQSSDIIRATESTAALYRMLRRTKVALDPVPDEIIPVIDMGRNLCVTHREEQFYRYSPSNYGSLEVVEDIVIFYSTSLTNDLKIERLWSVDRTFSVIPAPFYQLYTISYVKQHLSFTFFRFIEK